MLIGIEEAIFEKYPTTEIGYLRAHVCVKKEDPFVENLKKNLQTELRNKGLAETTFATHPSISLWRNIYEDDFHVKAKTYRSSLEALVRRVVTGKSLWNISTIVDLYNCCSILSLLPMGGYDLNKVSGDICIRFGKNNEPFQGLGSQEIIEVQPSHVVYADNKRVMCWLWNHKDSLETCIDEHSTDIVFFIDAFEHNQAELAINLLSTYLEKIGATPQEAGILNKASPYKELHKGPSSCF